MADTHSKEVRSKNMSHIRSTNSRPEEIVRKYLFSKGLRYRKNVRRLPGCPDIVLSKYKTVVFVNGCFWHMHDCGRFVWPKSNTEYWHQKISRNIERDKENHQLLQEQGWRVLIIWECQLKKAVMESNLSDLYKKITQKQQKRARQHCCCPARFYSFIVASVFGYSIPAKQRRIASKIILAPWHGTAIPICFLTLSLLPIN